MVNIFLCAPKSSAAFMFSFLSCELYPMELVGFPFHSLSQIAEYNNNFFLFPVCDVMVPCMTSSSNVPMFLGNHIAH